MVTAMGSVQPILPFEQPSGPMPNLEITSDSFAQQFGTVIQQYSAPPSPTAPPATPAAPAAPAPASQTSATSQVTVTELALASALEQTSTAPASKAVTPSATTTTTSAAYSTSSATGSSDTTGTTTIDKSKMTPTDAYWAEQPPAVQALRTCPDDQKFAMAQQLSQEGYAIDMPIMVWGWDPLVTMTLRQQEGYTWVPSAFQANIPIGPGITNVWNLPGYDPNNPPAGSIKVSTDFANGTNGQDPWMKTLTTQTS